MNKAVLVSKATSVSLIVAVAAVVLAMLLNPSAEQHRAKIKQVIAERSQLERALGVGQFTAFASKYKSLGIASYTTVNEQVTSVGVLGMVFVAD
ncbi:MAG TPA: hypothetical protein VJ608_04230 [Albitalea sp.]|nr:hypothetical protein [Albitalea sp.]